MSYQLPESVPPYADDSIVNVMEWRATRHTAECVFLERVMTSGQVRHSKEMFNRQLRHSMVTFFYKLLDTRRMVLPATTADYLRRDVYSWLRSRKLKCWHALADKLERIWRVRIKVYEAEVLFSGDDLPVAAHDGIAVWRELHEKF